jgi:hypothetical protein
VSYSIAMHVVEKTGAIPISWLERLNGGSSNCVESGPRRTPMVEISFRPNSPLPLSSQLISISNVKSSAWRYDKGNWLSGHRKSIGGRGKRLRPRRRV